MCVRRWVSSLRGSKIAETTVNHYFKNVAQFCDYISETPPPTCRLSKQALLRIRRELRAVLKSMKRSVMMHQIDVKQAKEANIISKAVLRQCRSEAKQAIPRILGRST